MKTALIPVVAMFVAIASASVHADQSADGAKTRAQVRAELVQARAAGFFNGPDATYPEAQLRAAAASQPDLLATTATGGAATGHSRSGRRTASPAQVHDSIYFGH